MAIYTISDWSSGTTYSLYDIVKYNSNYYYSAIDGNLNNTPASDSSSWFGVTSYFGVSKPYFQFKPNYNSPINVAPSIKEIKFGETYSQRIPETIANILLKLDLTFDLRTANEAQAINHFLHTRKGCESFCFIGLPPFDVKKLYVCKNWTSNFVFLDNFSVRCSFEEVPV